MKKETDIIIWENDNKYCKNWYDDNNCNIARYFKKYPKEKTAMISCSCKRCSVQMQ